MRRWLQWQFVVPRVLLCLVAALGVHLAVGLAVRSIATRSGTQLLGAQFDVANARVALSDGYVLLGGISVEDPHCPGKSWLKAECCELEVEGSQLLNKRTIISTARMSGVQLGNSIAASDSTPTASPSSSDLSRMPGWFSDHAVEAAETRLAEMGDRFGEEFLSRLESVRRITAFCTSWPKTMAALDARAAELERSAAEVEKILSTASANPLRHDRTLDDVSAKVTELRNDLESLSADFDKLPQQLEQERRSIVAARRQDEQFVRDKLQVETIDDSLLNAYLLRAQVSQPLDRLIAWLRCLRQIAPAEATKSFAAKRGQNVLFTGIHREPSFLIRALELQGEARLVDRPIEFRGLVSHFTTTPALHGEPMKLRFSATGSAAFEVRATIDRTGGRVRDELFADCREIPMGEQLLGHAERLRLKLAPSVGSVTVSMAVEDDKLSGEVQLVQQRVVITPEFASAENKSPVEEAMKQSLGKVESLATRISLDGTLDRPMCKLWSNLGSAVAESLEHGWQRQAEAHARVVLADARRHVDERLADLERQMTDHRESFTSKTASLPQRIDAIAQSQARRERISVEQVGRRLPTTSILR